MILPDQRCAALLFTLVLLAGNGQGQPPEPTAQEVIKAAPAALGTITAADLATHLDVIASDAFGGRLTGTEGLTKAADYVAERLGSYGLQPLGDQDGQGRRVWTQGYDVTLTEVLPASGLADAAGRKLNAHGSWSLPRPRRGAEPARLDLEGPLRWLGRVAKGDLAGMDLSGVLPVAVLPQDTSRDAAMTITRAMTVGMQRELGRIRSLATEMAGANAKAAIAVSKEFNVSFQVAANLMALYPGKPLVNLGDKPGEGMMGGLAPRPPIPVLVLGGPDARAVLEALGLDPEQVFAEEAAVPGGGESTTRHRLSLATATVTTKAVNVVGWIEGRDPELKSEALVYSAHLDHVGLAPDGQAFNGADDDGSGTVALLELAQAFAGLPAGERPRRSLVFLAVSGEELGLWGSAWYVDHPTWPIDRIAADINMDMIGRSTEKVPADAVAVTPTFRLPQYSTLAREAAFLAPGFGLRFVSGDQFYTRSDHYNFAEKDVPVLFFTDDEHADYHLPTDDVGKIEFDKMERTVRLAFLLGLRTADRAGRPEVLGARTDWFGEKAAPRKPRSPAKDPDVKTPEPPGQGR